ncbi:MAG: hypothetical protein FWF59_03435 [Turicibacter sp.]|nr:hypothetical protein [Turicibacter sp.]
MFGNLLKELKVFAPKVLLAVGVIAGVSTLTPYIAANASPASETVATYTLDAYQLPDEVIEVIRWAEENGIQIEIDLEALNNPKLKEELTFLQLNSVEEAKQFLWDTKDGFNLGDSFTISEEENFLGKQGRLVQPRHLGVHTFTNWTTTATGFNVNTSAGTYWLGGLVATTRYSWTLDDSTAIRQFANRAPYSFTATLTGWEPFRSWSQIDWWHSFSNNRRNITIQIRGNLTVGTSLLGVPANITRVGSGSWSFAPGA